MVQEAKKLMAADDDEEQVNANKGDEEGGSKIKMGRIGKKKKKGGADVGAKKSEAFTKKIGIVSDDSRPMGGGFNENDIEFMKKAIQILCQSTLPLGKSIDFVTDDVDSMSKEYEHWRKEAIACNHQLEE